jgi:glucose-6-phosphate isomerase
MNPVESPIWRSLETHAQVVRPLHMRELFASDPQRFKNFSLQQEGLLLDFSKQRINSETLTLLHELAQATNMEAWKQKMLAGETINHTEGRAVGHMALRAGAQAPAEVRAVLKRLERFCESLHGGTWRGFSGERITDIVNIGIGGSDLGPRMATTALAASVQSDLKLHFVANIDGADIGPLLEKLKPATTLFIVASKTFSTQETLINAHSARNWLLATARDETAIARHFVAVSANPDLPGQFGIAADNVFEIWDWVGGRFSVWSAIGLSLALAIGWRNFEQFLAGARAMDRHFMASPARENLPLTLALLSLWNTDFLLASTAAVLPYSQSLALLPAYLQQLEMESNGKQINRDGALVGAATSPIIWGEAGTNGQHSFYQLLHQGGRCVPCDFIVLRQSDFPVPGHHVVLLANCLAHAAALAFGQTIAETRAAGVSDALAAYKVFPGNQPSTTLVLPALTPYTLGQLLALFEHKVFCLGVLWNLNSFDQWGVELGKKLTGQLTSVLSGTAPVEGLDASTRGLITALRSP